MTGRIIMNDYVLAHPEEFSREDSQTQSEQVNDDDLEFREHVKNAAKNLKSKMKALPIGVSNSKY
jgi:hypothetical protein